LIRLSHIGGTLGEYRIIKATKDSVFAEKGATASKPIKNGLQQSIKIHGTAHFFN
jgi:hypothetical protein